MQILAISSTYSAAHDGCIACVEDGRLRFSLEAEKDSGDRYASLSEELVRRGLARMSGLPDVLVQGGWEGDYLGLEVPGATQFEFFKKIRSWRTSHERAHIFCSYGLSPFPQGQPCYALIWEGTIGTFYKIDAQLNIEKLGTPMWHPGHRYQALWALPNAAIGDWYELAARAAPEHALHAFRRVLGCLVEQPEGPGKMMALAAFADASSDDDAAVVKLVDYLTTMEVDGALIGEPHTRLDTVVALLDKWEPFCRVAVEDQVFKNIVQRLSCATYDTFYSFAKANLRERLPLVIGGGCGLNCTWNTQWQQCGLFPETFIPPCPNDSGIAIGSAIDAQHVFTGSAKVQWSVMAGEEFVLDADLDAQPHFIRQPLDLEKLARLLAAHAVVGWVQGKYEMGPRALGHRSILAAPFDASMLTRLNKLKKRDAYRPIAPMCLEEDVSEHFHWSGPSPYMLHFQKLKTGRLKAVTHVDGTARVQTVNEAEGGRTYQLLREFKKQTGCGVLCNTSLNFKGKGFINRASDLLRFAWQEGLDAVVIDDEMLIGAAALGKYS